MRFRKKPAVFILLYVAVLGTLAVLKHRLFHTYAFDLGVYFQALYSTWTRNGLLLETPDTPISTSYLGVHFSPMLFALVPLVGVFPYPETLLIFQTLTLALPGYILYKDVMAEARSEKLASMVCAWYLMNPALHGINLYDFHTQSLMLLPSYFLANSLKNRDVKKTVALLLILFTISEQALFIGLGLITYIFSEKLFCKRKIWTRGLVAATVTTLSMSTVALLAIWRFGKPPIGLENGTVFFPQLGSTWGEVFSNLLTMRVVDALTNDAFWKILYWAVLLFPLYLWDWKHVAKVTLPMLAPWITFTSLTGYRPFYTLGWQFNGLVLGTIAAAVVEQAEQLPKVGNKFRTSVPAIFTLAALLSPASVVPYAFSSLGLGASYDFHPLVADISRELKTSSTIVSALSYVPSNASILTTTNIFPHVADRSNAYVAPTEAYPEYILLDYRFVGFKYFDHRILQLLSEEYDLARYGVVVHSGEVVLLKLNYSDEPKLFKSYLFGVNPRELSWLEKNLRFDEGGCALVRLDSNEERPVWFGPFVTLPPGLYTIRVRASAGNNNVLRIKVSDFNSRTTLVESESYTFQLEIPLKLMDNMIEIKGYHKGVGELRLCDIDIEVIQVRN